MNFIEKIYMKINNYALLIILFICTNAALSFSNKNDSDDALEQELNYLRAENISHVITASKREQTSNEAPANITVITHQEIEELGVFSLSEVLSFIPGVTVLETYFGYTDIIFRGNFQEHYNNKSLLMVNSHPFWEVVNGSYHLEAIPINSIKQIEIIRGPGSVLYGTNAYAGVINIITFNGKEVDGGTISARTGSFNTQEYGVSFGKTINNIDFFLSATLLDNDGYNFNVDNDEMGGSGIIDYENDISNLFTGFSYAGFTLNAGYFSQDKQKIGIVPILVFGGENHFEGYYMDLKYEKSFNKNLAIQWNLRHDDSDRISRVSNFDAGRDIDLLSGGKKSGGEFQLFYDFNESLRIIGGVAYDSYESEPYLFQIVNTDEISTSTAYYDSASTIEKGYYIQADGKITPKLNLIGGIRFNDNSRAGQGLSPSLGTVYELTKNTYFKVLYGEAFRSPNFFEQMVDVSGIIFGDPNLKAERIKTLDLGIDHSYSKNYSTKLNLFFLDTNDTIERSDTNGDGIPDYINSEGQKIHGLEFELNRKAKNLSAFFNVSYRDGELKESGKDIPFIANYSGNAGLTWNYTNKLPISFNLQYIGNRKSDNVTIDDYFLSNLQFTYKPSTNYKLFFTINNLFDQEYSYPEYIRQRIDDIPGGPERTFFGKIEFNF